MSENEGRTERIPWLDGWRGAAVWLMLVYHLLFDFILFGWMSYDVVERWPMVLFEKVIAYSFILCAGISSTLSRSNLKRGLITLAAGGVVTAVSYIVDTPILFGVLQFLGLSMMLYAGVRRVTDRVPAKLAPFLWIVLFIAASLITDAVRVRMKWLFWLGFLYDGFVSFDYFPLLPYFFLFLLGTWAGLEIRRHGDRMPFLRRRAPGVLVWPGRHALLVYMLHQPVLYGGCYVASYLMQRS